MKEKLSILIVGNFLYKTSGVRAVCEDLSEQLVRIGWTVLTSSSKPGRVSRLVDMLVTIWVHRDMYKVATIDVFSGWSFFWAEMTAFTLRKLHKPYILILRGGNLPEFGERWSGRISRLLASAAAVVAPSGYMMEKMKPYRSDLRLIPNPIPISNYPCSLRKNPLPSLIWLRSFHEIYNPSLAVRVVANLAPRLLQIRLSMGGGDGGDGSLQKTKNLVEEQGISRLVEFPGRISKPDIPLWLQKGDIFINTPNVDNTPISVMEAMASGLPIVSTNVGGIPYLLEDDHDALLVPPNDVVAMSDAIERILTEPGLSERLSKNARQKVEKFDWSVILPVWDQTLRSQIGLYRN